MKEVKRKCAICGEKRAIGEMVKPSGSFRYACSPAISQACVAQLYLSLMEKQEQKKKRDYNAKTKAMKKAIESRLDLYAQLGKLVNQYCKHVLYKGKPCYTCGKQQSHGDAPGAFHAGHFIAAKRVDSRRFNPQNIRIQCYRCNTKLSGNQAEFRRRLEREIGEGGLAWLEIESNHKPLKEQYPGKDDIRQEIDRYRKTLRDNGIKPAV